MKPLRIYADTSVYGGVFDEEFARPSRLFFEQVEAGRLTLIISPLVLDEIGRAPLQVRELLEQVGGISEIVDLTPESLALRKAYMKAGIVGDTSRADALHVALATTTECRAIVSWNFKHIVHFNKIPLYNGVNKAQGYREIAIHSPMEVIQYESENLRLRGDEA